MRKLAHLGGACLIAVAFAVPYTAYATPKADDQLRAAAEPFENLTESAFTASSAALKASIGKVDAAAQRVRELLPRDSAQRLGKELSSITKAYRDDDRASIALSSIEGYRILVSAVTGAPRVPVAVSLLDYAGFRYNADLKAAPTRWGDMASAVNYADQTWQSLAPRVSVPTLKTQEDEAIAGMERAVQRHDAAAASRSVSAELDIVDQLEKYFG